MKTRLLFFGFIISLLAFSLLLSAGCGDETERASDIARSGQTSINSVQSKNAQASNLITQALDQMAAGQSDQVKTTLTQAQSLTDQIKTDLFDGKSKIDQAASMDISSEYRSYLNAKGKSIENSIALNTTDQEMISLWLSDPLMNKPDTLQKFTEMQNKETQQGDAVVAAEAEADAIATANPDKIQ